MLHHFTGKERSIQGRLPSLCGATFPNLCFGLILLMPRLLAVESLALGVWFKTALLLHCCRQGGRSGVQIEVRHVSKVHPRDTFQLLLHAMVVQLYEEQPKKTLSSCMKTGLRLPG